MKPSCFATLLGVQKHCQLWASKQITIVLFIDPTLLPPPGPEQIWEWNRATDRPVLAKHRTEKQCCRSDDWGWVPAGPHHRRLLPETRHDRGVVKCCDAWVLIHTRNPVHKWCWVSKIFTAHYYWIFFKNKGLKHWIWPWEGSRKDATVQLSCIDAEIKTASFS